MRLKALARRIAAAQKDAGKTPYDIALSVLPVVISLAAFGLSGVSFYRTAFYVNNSLELRLIGEGLQRRIGVPGDESKPAWLFQEIQETEYAVTVILVNSGNRDALVLSANLFVPDDDDRGVTVFGKEDAVSPFSMKPGEIKVVPLPFKRAQVRSATMVPAYKEVRLWLKIETIDSYGRHASNWTRPAAYLSPARDGSFWLKVQDVSTRLID